jgi:hypothetical protein
MSDGITAGPSSGTATKTPAKSGSRTRVRSERTSAITVGVLYILATAVALPAAALSAPMVLSGLAAHEAQVLGTVFFQMVMALTVAGVGCMLYPVLRKDADSSSKQGLAIWYVGTRITEGALFMVGILALLAMLVVSKEAAGAGAGQVAQYQAMGAALKAMSEYSWILGQSIFSVGAAMLYYLLYVSRRVPRWLAVWGLIAAPLMLLGGFMLPFTGDMNSTVSTVLYAPMGIQEMVLAVWLIARGFNTPLVAVRPREEMAR